MPEPQRLATLVATVVRNYAEETYVSQAELSRKSGVSQPHISNVFTGKSVFSIDQLDAICSALGLKVTAVIHEADSARRR
ncbi:helix-turn-helix transcriptional regulator [Agromyces sp. NBRC 114283]|uniref:helix-turn-helix domain-containing protein n=1 Tax=Agromyces sp. NBRC 114283 TaxID=2994521 RepID=UPI0024A2306F|nr:hypothetical protein Agsp01_11430 [Agromyces sp. NBRC 114283]